MSKTYIKGYKFKIYPTPDQAKQLDEFINLSRYVYNWGIAKEEEIYDQYQRGISKDKFYNYTELSNLFNEERHNNPELNWLLKYPLTTSRNPLNHVIDAFMRFFDGISNYPKFKKKNKCKKSFDTRYDRFSVLDKCIKIEGINTHISLGFKSGININKALNPVISKNNLGDYYVSFSLEEKIEELKIDVSEPIGIDLGKRHTFTLSTGEIYNQPYEKLDRLGRKLKREKRRVTRDRNRILENYKHTKTKYEDIPKSKRSIKREIRKNKTIKKIANIKNTFYHTITKQIAMRNPEFVCMETFQVSKWNKHARRHSNDVSFYDITFKMKYKCEKYNIPFIQAPSDFASTQLCNNCGHKKKMYSNKTYICPNCGMRMDRDINAAINLKNYGLDLLYSYIEK